MLSVTTLPLCEPLVSILHISLIWLPSYGSFYYFSTFGFICLSYLWIINVVMRSSKNESRKVLSTCFSHLIVVVCYYIPLFVRIVFTRMGLVLTHDEREGLMIGAILGPSLVNPFVYCLRTKEIKNKLFGVFKKVKTNYVRLHFLNANTSVFKHILYHTSCHEG